MSKLRIVVAARYYSDTFCHNTITCSTHNAGEQFHLPLRCVPFGSQPTDGNCLSISNIKVYLFFSPFDLAYWLHCDKSSSFTYFTIGRLWITKPLSSFHVLSRTHNDRIKDHAIKVLRAAASDN